MLLFLLNRRVISGTLSHNMIVQGILERFVWVNSAQGHRIDALHDPKVKAALIIILYTVTNKSVPLCAYVWADPGWISLRQQKRSSIHTQHLLTPPASLPVQSPTLKQKLNFLLTQPWQQQWQETRNERPTTSPQPPTTKRTKLRTTQNSKPSAASQTPKLSHTTKRFNKWKTQIWQTHIFM